MNSGLMRLPPWAKKQIKKSYTKRKLYNEQIICSFFRDLVLFFPICVPIYFPI